MSNIEDVKHIINFLKDNEIETGHKRGVEPLEEMVKELEQEKTKRYRLKKRDRNETMGTHKRKWRSRTIIFC